MKNMEFSREKYVAPPEERFEEKESSKSRIVAGVLALLLGTFGIHSFYLGYTKKGILHLVLALTGILTVASTAWALGECIMLLCGKSNKDAEGNILL